MGDHANPEAKGKAPSYVDPVDGASYIWYVSNLYPLRTSVIGVYDHPPPADQDQIRGFRLDAFGGWDSIVQAQVIRAARGLTSGKDFLHRLLESAL